MVANAVSTAAASTHVARAPVAHVASARTWRSIPEGTCLLLPAYVLPGVGLAILHRLATSGAAVLARSLPVAVGRASTVLRVVLPVTVAPGRLISWAVASVSVVHVLPIAVVREDEAPGASIDSQARIWLDAAAALP